VDPLAGYQCPGKKQFRHPGIGFDIVSQKIFNRLVPADPEPASPGTLDGHFRRRDHEEHIDKVAKAGQQLARPLFEIGHKAVKAKTVDQQVRHFSSGSTVSHPAVQLLVDDFNFVSRQGAGIFVSGAE
jgi:hypothetical protein